MASRLNPYITFNGNARVAMEFYRRVFGGTLIVRTYAEFGASESVDPDQVMHAQLETPSGYTLMGADPAPGAEYKGGDNISVSLSGDDADELRGYWQQLADGGTITVPLEKQMWGDEFGMCVDRFGTPWMVDIGEPLG